MLRNQLSYGLLSFLLFIFLLAPTSSDATIIDAIKYTASQSTQLASNAASKIIEKANEYGYDDIDILVRFGMGIKYPEGIEVRDLDAVLALLDLSLTATEKGIGYINFLFRNNFTKLLIQSIPYFTGGNSFTDLIVFNIKTEFRNYLSNYRFGAFLNPNNGKPFTIASPFYSDPIAKFESLPTLDLDVPVIRRNISSLNLGIRYFNGSLSNELYKQVLTFFPQFPRQIPAQLLTELSSGQLLFSSILLLKENNTKFTTVNQFLEDGGRFVRTTRNCVASDTEFKIIMSIPTSLDEMKHFTSFMERIPDAVPLITRHGKIYYQLIKDLSHKDFLQIKPLGENLFLISDIYKEAGIKFCIEYSTNGASFLYYMNHPTSYMKRRLTMISFFWDHGWNSISWLFKLQLLSPMEPILLIVTLLFLLFIVIYFHISGYLVLSELSALPLRQKLAVILILLLAFGAFYWTLVENARLLIDEDIKPQQIVYSRPPKLQLTPDGFLSTTINAVESAEVQFINMTASGLHFRTTEVQFFQKSLRNLRSNYVTVLESFEVRLISEPKLYENYNQDKILSEHDLLADITISIKNFDREPRLFPLVIELSTVTGNLIPPSQGHQRLMKTTFNPGVKDIFTLTFPVRLEDRPDRIVIRKEYILHSKEKFITFGPGTPLKIGDLLPLKWGVIFFSNLDTSKTGEVSLQLEILSSYDTTKEVEFLCEPENIRTLFLTKGGKEKFFPKKITGNYPEFPSLLPNRIQNVLITFDCTLDSSSYLVLNNKKILLTPYNQFNKVAKITRNYLKRIAATSEFELGMYYLNPPIYRRWARDIEEAKKHFLRAKELLPDLPMIDRALRLTTKSESEENNK